ncbi:EAL and GGDEF domain-containing protein [Oceanospirillum sp.]|uniref:sensor domain-containing protein n=1 Tax=Oceanospirillum sp. TaxID=2021254 RepID=UPI003A92F5AB
MNTQGKAYINPSLFDTGPVVFFTWGARPVADDLWPVQYVTDNIADLAGYTANTFLEKKQVYSDLVHPDDLKRLVRDFSQVIDSDTSRITHNDYRLCHRDGHYIWVTGVTMIHRTDTGIPERFSGYLVDVSASRKHWQSCQNDSEQRYHQLFKRSRVVELLFDPESGDLVDANEAACRFYGYNYAQLTSLNASDINVMSEEEIAQAMVEAEEEKRNHFVFRHKLASGEVRDVEIHSGPVEFHGQKLLYSIVHDITSRLEAEREREKLSNALDQSGSSVMLTDAEYRIEYVNWQFCQVSGFSPDEVIGRHVDFLSAGRTSPEVRRQLAATLGQGKPWHGELLCRRKNGELFWQSMSISPIACAKGEIEGFVAVGEDLTAQRETDRKIQQLAFFDPITGLGNRQFLLDNLDEFFAESEASGFDGQTVLVFIDLDDFKRVNDSLGHSVGDRLIKTAAHRLKVVVSDSDILVRLGGDEFAIMHCTNSREKLNDWLDQLCYQFNRTVKLGPHTINAFASIGVAFLPQDAADTTEALRNAELAMYKAKQQTGSNCHFFSQELNQQAQKRLDLEVRLRKAMQHNQLELYYQPKVCLKKQDIVGVEALIRWNDPERGLISPLDFIPFAEETGLILPISHWVLETACKQIVNWHNAGRMPVRMAINLSVRQFQDPGFVSQVETVLKHTGVDPKWIELEITESMLMESMDDMLPVLHELKRLGVSLAIDDFGTGYSSLAYLKQMPIDVLKVDRAFVKDLPHGQNDCAITRTIIVLAQQLGLSVVAEGIEQIEQAEFLTDSGCDIGQGFLYSRPLTLTDLEEKLSMPLHS